MKINDILGIKYPIIQGGMANIATGEFAASVCEAGGLGLIGSGGMSPEVLSENIDILKERTTKPFGVNLMLMHPEADRMAELLIEKEVPIVTTGAGNPAKYIERWKQAGMKIFPVVPNPSLGVRMERLGVDGLIAEGNEAGGHIGNMTTMTLLPQIIEKVSIPVIAAGGIASGVQMLACEVMGAAGVQIGTAFLATEECPIHEAFKEKLLKSGDTNVTVIGQKCGIPIRLLRNEMTREYTEKENCGWDRFQLEEFTLGALRRAVLEGDITGGSLMAGLTVGQIEKIVTVAELLERLYCEYLKEREEFKNGD